MSVLFFISFSQLTVFAEREVVVRSLKQAKQRSSSLSSTKPPNSTIATKTKHSIKTSSTVEPTEGTVKIVKNTKNGKEVTTFSPKTNKNDSEATGFNSFFAGLTRKIFGFTAKDD